MPSYREDLKQVCAEYRKCLRRCRRLRVDALGKYSRPYVMTPDQDQALRDLKWVMSEHKRIAQLYADNDGPVPSKYLADVSFSGIHLGPGEGMRPVHFFSAMLVIILTVIFVFPYILPERQNVNNDHGPTEKTQHKSDQ